jgi:hypothetical protein
MPGSASSSKAIGAKQSVERPITAVNTPGMLNGKMAAQEGGIIDPTRTDRTLGL